MQKESYTTNEEKATNRSREIALCKKAHAAQNKIEGHYINCNVTRCQVFVPKGTSEETVLSRHIKWFELQKQNKNFGRIIND